MDPTAGPQQRAGKTSHLQPCSRSQDHPQSKADEVYWREGALGMSCGFSCKGVAGTEPADLPAAVGDIHQAPWQGKLTSLTERELMKAGFCTTFSKISSFLCWNLLKRQCW